uniref:CNH domain-containing protein n=1 Tax=Hucho hucho TaxID=62062 RepID=A0A4W5JI69_9TELE
YLSIYLSIYLTNTFLVDMNSLAGWFDWLLVGTKPGHLLLYRIKKDAGTNRFEVTLEKSNKNFSKKIQQLFIVSQYKILISLLENNIHVHDLLTFQQITVVSKAKGATLFACDLQLSPSGDAQLRMCVAVKKKLQLYYWKDREFYELQGDFAAPDIPKSMAWCQNSICVGFKRDYYLIRVSGEQQTMKHCVWISCEPVEDIYNIMYMSYTEEDTKRLFMYPQTSPP